MVYLPYVGANLVFALNPDDHKDRPYEILPDKLGWIFQRFKSFFTFHKYLGYITTRGTIPTYWICVTAQVDIFY